MRLVLVEINVGGIPGTDNHPPRVVTQLGIEDRSSKRTRKLHGVDRELAIPMLFKNGEGGVTCFLSDFRNSKTIRRHGLSPSCLSMGVGALASWRRRRAPGFHDVTNHRADLRHLTHPARSVTATPAGAARRAGAQCQLWRCSGPGCTPPAAGCGGPGPRPV